MAGAHRRCEPGGLGALDLETKPSITRDNQKVQLCAGVGRPVKTLLGRRFEQMDDLLDYETFPGGPTLGCETSSSRVVRPRSE